VKAGDFVACYRRREDKPIITGIVIEVFEIPPLSEHSRTDPLPMVKIATENGTQCWKRRKVKVINEY
jgi:hypothetical protein